MNAEKLVEQLRLMIIWDAGRAEAVLSQIDVPLTLLQSTTVGADNKRTVLREGERPAYLDTVSDLVPHAQTHIIPNCDHFTQLEAADQAIGAFARHVFG